MNHSLAVLIAFFCVFGLAACSSSGGKSSAAKPKGIPSKFKPDDSEVPAQVRAQETVIDKDSVILANEAVVYVSKNYEFDVSLTGDDVSKDLDDSGARDSVAQGSARAFVRNLKIECDQRIRMKIADFGTEPFIKISARGHCSHIILGEGEGDHEIKRAAGIEIRNSDIRYLGNVGAVPVATVEGIDAR